MATRARASNNQVNARSPDSDVGECRDTGRPGGSWDGLLKMVMVVIIMIMVIYTYIMDVCLYVTKNEHFVSKQDVLPLSVCLSRSIITSHVTITGAKRDVENTPKCTCPNFIIAP